MINTTINDVYRSTPIGDLDRAIGSSYYGLNHEKSPILLRPNTDDYGYVFFTRPQLNMQSQNLANERRYLQLLTTEEASIQRIVRCTLDPRLAYLDRSYNCPLVDPQQAFIPMLSNQCIRLPNWPDPTNDTYTSKPGAYKEEFSYVDSAMDIYRTFDLGVSYWNTQGSPIPLLFDTWRLYQTQVFEGVLVPYADFIAKQMIDYQTRIYRLVMDRSRTIVTHIGATGVAYPLVSNKGAMFDYDTTASVNTGFNEIEVQFRCTGMIYDDPILVDQFNKVVRIFNPAMADDVRETYMTPIPLSDRSAFKNEGYPHIDMSTRVLSWWVTKERYNVVLADFERHYKALAEKKPAQQEQSTI